MQIRELIISARLFVLTIIVSVCLIFVGIHKSNGEGDLAKRAKRLPPVTLDSKKGFSQNQFHLETGKFYRLRIISDGRDEYSFRFPELSQNIWIHQISIADKEVKPFGGIHSLEFDDAGEIDLFFIPIRPGKYQFYVENYRESGMSGIIEVK